MKAGYTKEDLIAHIINLRLKEMWSTKSILEFLEKLGYGKTQCYEYLKWAKQEIKDRYNETNDALIEEAIYQYEQMLEKAAIAGNLKLWNELKKELNKIQGIYAAEKVDITSGGEKITEIKIIEVKGETGIKDNNNIQPE
jgi:hypothetical protein